MPKKDFRNSLRDLRGGIQDNYVVGEGEDARQANLTSLFVQQLEEEAKDLPITEIEIEKLHDNPYQHLARIGKLDPDSLQELADSIKQSGFYSTLLARPKPGSNGRSYELAFGHRRREAAKLAGLTTLPVKIKTLSDDEMFNAMASENIVREDLTVLGEANLVGTLATERNMSMDRIASTLNKKRGWVEPRLRLFEASDDIKNMVAEKPNTLTLIQYLQRVTDNGERAKLINLVLEDKLTRTELEKRVARGRSDFSQADNSSQAVVKEVTNFLPQEESYENHNPAKSRNGKINPELQGQLEQIFATLDATTSKLEALITIYGEDAITAYTKANPNSIKALSQRLRFLESNRTRR